MEQWIQQKGIPAKVFDKPKEKLHFGQTDCDIGFAATYNSIYSVYKSSKAVTGVQMGDYSILHKL